MPRIHPLPAGKDIISTHVRPHSRFKVIFVDTINPVKEDTNKSKQKTSFQCMANIKQPCHLTRSLARCKTDLPVPHQLPQPCSIKHLVENYLDIQGVPRRHVFELLSHFTSSELEKEKLQEFCSAEGQVQINFVVFNFNLKTKSTYKMMAEFDANIPFEYLFDLIPPIQPRAFSIASSLKAHPDEIQLLVVVVNYKTKLVKPRRGLCSTWLASLDPFEQRLSCTCLGEERNNIISQGFRLTYCHGTGCAPFRSFIEERTVCCSLAVGIVGKISSSKTNGISWWKIEDCSCLLLSREIRLLEHRFLVWDFLVNKQGWFYIAGNSQRVPTDVTDALLGIFMKERKMDRPKAEEFHKKLESTRHLQSETWS
ncbi:hypothetical protein pdam_00007849 [Pocillopora damicornis]|uniref:Sulfite reductase [NADPH] flavoprotein alpha-component-like FAD-binding domain-containing protein n=1 Tax=Pocillopora damicornis TaxID=46731 RepID=A0A3M6TY18_POCDA|nr:hypothetical protein pdam_00007849 [Pocillopora damicornis]